MKPRIPDVAVKRLPVYLRALLDLQEEQNEIVSSAELARLTGFASEQIRKDLAYFGAFGTRGVGYSTSVLAGRIRKILGLGPHARAVLVGAGNLGTALARYNATRDQHVRIVAVFDVSPDKIGQDIGGIPIYALDQLPRVVQEEAVRMAILTVPAEAAQQVLDQLVDAGVEAVLNFSPVKLRARRPIQLQSIDLSLALQTLAYYATGDGAADDALPSSPDMQS